MVKNCCVLGCTSNTKRNPAISFFRFPTDSTLASMWLQLIGRPDFKPSQYSVICQLHFTRDDFTSGSHHYPITGIGGQRKRLKTKAIPTQNLNGCANPEMLAEIQMRAKNTPHKTVKPIMSNSTMLLNNSNNNNLQKSPEAVQIQQLLTSLMPALFGSDKSGGNFSSPVSSSSGGVTANINTTTLTPTFPPVNMGTSTSSFTKPSNTLPGCEIMGSTSSVFTTPVKNSPLSSFIPSPPASSPSSHTPSYPPYPTSLPAPHYPTPRIVSSVGPIISLPANLQEGSNINNTASHVTESPEPIMSASLVKSEPSSSSTSPFKHGKSVSPQYETNLIYSLTNGLTPTTSSSNSLRSDGLSPSNSDVAMDTTSPQRDSDLFLELQNSLLTLKQNLAMAETGGVKKPVPSGVILQQPVQQHVQQPVQHVQRNTPAVAMDTSNNAYIIDVNTYQKLLETVAHKSSEKSIQTEQDIKIFSMETEIKQLKEQLYQYELAFNSLINWTEGSLLTDTAAAVIPTDTKLLEGKFIE